MIMTRIPSWLMATVAAVLAVLGGRAISAQDKYTVQVPGGLALSEFRGYEGWQTIAVSQTEEVLKVILGNPVIIDAYQAGVPGDGKQFPDGSMIAKIEWNPRRNPEAPFSVRVPDTLRGAGFMVKDSRRFPDGGGWGYAQFSYASASDTFKPDERYVGNAKCGVACHTIVQAKDYVFTAYQKR
jgi:hypothetical protein